MNARVTTAELKRQLFGADLTTYALLDGASIPGLPKMFAIHQPDHVCLLRGELDADLAAAAPYLVKLDADSPFADFVLSGWGEHWGVFALTQAKLRELRKHFRTFLMVRDPSGKPMYFRYYDPRVLRIYLPTCNEDEADAVFGPVARYVMEGEDPMQMVKFWIEYGAIKQQLAALKA
ncbi:MAG: DUF4123 domain-containing protein [Gammaproteobacteria bacterium]